MHTTFFHLRLDVHCDAIRLQMQILNMKRKKKKLRDKKGHKSKTVRKERKSEYHLDERKFIHKLISGN